MNFKPGDHVIISDLDECYVWYEKCVTDHFGKFEKDWQNLTTSYKGARGVVMGSVYHGIYGENAIVCGVMVLNPQKGGSRFFLMDQNGLAPAGWGKKRSTKRRAKKTETANKGPHYYIRGSDFKWKQASIKEFREYAMKRQPYGCSCASVTDEFHGWECAVTGGECEYFIPNALLCAKQFGEGPLALNH